MEILEPRRFAASTGPPCPAFPKEVCNALIVASVTIVSRTCATFPLLAVYLRSAQNSVSAFSSVLIMSCVAGGDDRSLSPDIPIGNAIAAGWFNISHSEHRKHDESVLDSVNELRNISERKRPYASCSVSFASNAVSSACNYMMIIQLNIKTCSLPWFAMTAAMPIIYPGVFSGNPQHHHEEAKLIKDVNIGQ
jgi:hypothetical protein